VSREYDGVKVYGVFLLQVLETSTESYVGYIELAKGWGNPSIVENTIPAKTLQNLQVCFDSLSEQFTPILSMAYYLTFEHLSGICCAVFLCMADLLVCQCLWKSTT
jgi:hypothetical protein